MSEELQKILSLSVEEKLDAIAEIWDSIDENNLPVTDEVVSIAKERYEEYLKNPDDIIPWEKAKEILFKKYGL